MIDEKRMARLREKYGLSTNQNTTALPLAPLGPGRPGRGRGGPGSRFLGSKPQDTGSVLRQLVAYMRHELAHLLLAGFLVILSAFATLASSYMLRPIINTYIAPAGGEGDLPGLAHALVLMGVFYAISLASNYSMNRITLSVSQRTQKSIRNELFRKIQQLPVEFYDMNSNGEIMSRFINDVDTISEMLNHTLNQILSGAVTLVGTLGLMFYTNWILTMVMVCSLPLTGLYLNNMTKRGRRLFTLQQAALGTLNGFIEESITGQKVVQVFCHEDIAIDEFICLNEDYRDKQIRAQRLSNSMFPVTNAFNNLCYVLMSCIGVVLCTTRGFDIGGLTVLVNYARQFGRPINEISGQMNTIYSALAGAERVFALLAEEPEPADGPDAVDMALAQGELRVDSVEFGYEPDRTILKGISFAAGKGQKVAFVGSTGAGKTTVANLIPRFYDIWDGAITIDGMDIRDIRRDSLRKQITLILQDTHLFSGTIRENIRYGRLGASDEEVVAAAKVANAHPFIILLRNGYDTVLDQDGSNLSQGQRQLLNIARAALAEAPILILDEATSSVDTRSEIQIQQGIDRLASERTTLVIAHRLSTIRNADMILVMEHGEIVERGDHESLLKQRGRYYELHTGLAELS